MGLTQRTVRCVLGQEGSIYLSSYHWVTDTSEVGKFTCLGGGNKAYFWWMRSPSLCSVTFVRRWKYLVLFTGAASVVLVTCLRRYWHIMS